MKQYTDESARSKDSKKEKNNRKLHKIYHWAVEYLGSIDDLVMALENCGAKVERVNSMYLHVFGKVIAFDIPKMTTIAIFVGQKKYYRIRYQPQLERHMLASEHIVYD